MSSLACFVVNISGNFMIDHSNANATLLLDFYSRLRYN
jgi:hypothetical protein